MAAQSNHYMSAPTYIKIDEVEYVRKDSIAAPKPLGNEVIVRCRDSGVHIGTLVEDSVNGRTLKLTNARRLWQWSGAFTLNAVSQNGIKRASSRISISVPEITLLDACEILPVAAGVDLTTTEKEK